LAHRRSFGQPTKANVRQKDPNHEREQVRTKAYLGCYSMIWSLLDKSSREKMFSGADPDAENSAHAQLLTDITRLQNQPYVSSSMKVSEGLVLDPKRKEPNSIDACVGGIQTQ
jgi:hypothetical protein